MNVVVAGAGSIGLLLGSYFAEAGVNVAMFVKRDEQAKALLDKGIHRLGSDGVEQNFTVQATNKINQLDKNSCWIVAVKYADLPSVLSQMRASKVSGPILFVQNGLAHFTLVRKYGFPNTFFATVEHGALRMNDYTVSHNGIGMMTVAIETGESTLASLLDQVKSNSFPVTFREDAKTILLRKTLMNCMINPLTAILEVENGELISNQIGHELLRSLYDEIMQAFPEMAEVLPIEAVENVCRQTAKNKSSMYADRLAGRPMEIETIVTAVMQAANENGKQLPFLGKLEKMLYILNAKEVEG